jgi:hypothetical protein
LVVERRPLAGSINEAGGHRHEPKDRQRSGTVPGAGLMIEDDAT